MAHVFNNSEIWTINNINELIQRFSLNPTQVNIDLYHHKTDIDDIDNYQNYYTLVGQPISQEPETDEKVEKIWSLLGMDESGHGKYECLSDLNDAIEHALSLAPRARRR